MKNVNKIFKIKRDHIVSNFMEKLLDKNFIFLNIYNFYNKNKGKSDIIKYNYTRGEEIIWKKL